MSFSLTDTVRSSTVPRVCHCTSSFSSYPYTARPTHALLIAYWVPKAQQPLHLHTGMLYYALHHLHTARQHHRHTRNGMEGAHGVLNGRGFCVMCHDSNQVSSAFFAMRMRQLSSSLGSPHLRARQAGPSYARMTRVTIQTARRWRLAQATTDCVVGPDPGTAI